MKTIVIEHSMIKQHDKIDIGLLTEGFIFNEFGLLIMHIGDVEKFKIGLQFFPDKSCCYVSVFKGLRTVSYYFAYNKMRGFEFANVEHDINSDQEEIDAAYALICLAMDACMTIKDAAYERAIRYKKHPEELEADKKEFKALKKIKKREKLPDVYLMGDLVIYAATEIPEEKLKRHFNCPVWEVRGFYRHYKNGKVQWINSFQKGRDRNKGLSGKDRTYIADKRDKNI